MLYLESLALILNCQATKKKKKKSMFNKVQLVHFVHLRRLCGPNLTLAKPQSKPKP